MKTVFFRHFARQNDKSFKETLRVQKGDFITEIKDREDHYTQKWLANYPREYQVFKDLPEGMPLEEVPGLEEEAVKRLQKYDILSLESLLNIRGDLLEDLIVKTARIKAEKYDVVRKYM